MHLRLEHVAVGYGNQAVLHSLSLDLPEGHVGCLLGPSGCGKTTALRAVAGFEPVRAGYITGDGVTLSAPGTHVEPEARGMGMVFQDLALLPHLNVYANIAFGLHRYPRRQRKARVDELLKLIGLPDAARAWPHTLSGGEQQRVALARALAPRPRLILLDEPFSALDLDLREHLAQDVRTIVRHEGTTALLVTHSQTEAFAMADHIGVIHAGHLAQWDSAPALYHHPASLAVAQFVGESRLLPGAWRADGAVETELGAVQVRRSGRCAAPVVRVLVRPEDLVVEDHGAVRARLIARVFRGAAWLYTLRLASGHEVLCRVPGEAAHAVGSTLGVRLVAPRVSVFEADSPAPEQPTRG